MRGILPAEEVDDCLGDVCVKVVESLGAFDPDKGPVKGWLAAVARNAALDRREALSRRRGREGPLDEPPPHPAPGPEEALVQKERADALQRALGELSQRDLVLFYRKYWYAQSTARIAAELGVTERAVEGRLYRLRRRLQKRLGKLLGGDAP